jgi:uncharacterized protein YbjT (DUF2867 family)
LQNITIIQHITHIPKTAIIFGATGLIGKNLLNMLIIDQSYDKIKIFVRKKPGLSHAKVEVQVSDLIDIIKLKDLIKGNDLFCCLGTTISKAGSQDAFRKIDYELPTEIAMIAAENKVNGFFVVSSLGADHNSSNFYLRTKGEMEEATKKSGVNSIGIFRPSLLLGARNEFRFGETMGKTVMKLINPLLFGCLKKYRGIEAADVAKAMIAAAREHKSGANIYQSDEIQKIADENL